jgi:hypothetical protein
MRRFYCSDDWAAVRVVPKGGLLSRTVIGATVVTFVVNRIWQVHGDFVAADRQDQFCETINALRAL